MTTPAKGWTPVPEWMHRVMAEQASPAHNVIWRRATDYRDFKATAVVRGATTVKRRTLAQRTGYDERTVQRAFARMAQLGVARAVFRGRGYAQVLVWARSEPFDFPATRFDPVDDPKRETEKETEKETKGETERESSVSPKRETPVSPPYQVERNQVEEPLPHPPRPTAVASNAIAPLPSEDHSRPRAGDGRTEARSEDKPTDPVDAIRDRVGSAWPRNDAEARRLTSAALAAGWTADPLVAELRDAAGRYDDAGAGVMGRLRELPAPPREPERVRSVQRPPRDPAEVAEERARAQRWKAEIRARLAARREKDADNGAVAEPVRTGAITGRPLPPSDGVFDLGAVLAPTRPPEDVLGPSEGVTDDAAVLDAFDPVDVLGNPITDDDYADAYAATGTD